jgi:hypothetical protein
MRRVWTMSVARVIMQSDRTIELRHISEALIASGYTTLDPQAKALGLGRSTAWTIIKNKHKLGRLSAKTLDRILSNPETPANVRAVVGQYISERSISICKKSRKETGPSSTEQTMVGLV